MTSLFASLILILFGILTPYHIVSFKYKYSPGLIAIVKIQAQEQIRKILNLADSRISRLNGFPIYGYTYNMNKFDQMDQLLQRLEMDCM